MKQGEWEISPYKHGQFNLLEWTGTGLIKVAVLAATHNNQQALEDICERHNAALTAQEARLRALYEADAATV